MEFSSSPSRQKIEEAFPGRTGRGLRIGVIDSGVHSRHPHINGVSGGIAIGAEDSLSGYVDFLGHGTAVMAAIKERAPDARFYAVKIYYRSLATHIETLTGAMEWCLDHKMDVINLSLGTLNEAHREWLCELTVRAAEANVVVVAAAEMNGAPALPGSLPGVISVAADADLPRELFRYQHEEGKGFRWFASTYPRALPGVPPSRNLQGISFSVANMCGFVARACESLADRSCATVSAVLREEADRLRQTP